MRLINAVPGGECAEDAPLGSSPCTTAADRAARPRQVVDLIRFRVAAASAGTEAWVE